MTEKNIMDKPMWSTENLIKLFGLFSMLSIQYFLIKQEIHDNKTNYDADKRIFEYRLGKVEKCCNIEQNFAILPKETESPKKPKEDE